MPNTKSIGIAYEDQYLDGATIANSTITSPTLSSPTISGGTINNAVIGGTTPAAGSFTVLSGTQLKLNAPVAKTASFSLGAAENFIVCDGSAANVAITFPTASANTGRVVVVKNLSATYTVISAASNVKPIGSDTPGTAILAASAGAWAVLVCDGANWVVMAAA